MKQLVECVGASWCSGRFGMWRHWSGATTGTQTVGGRQIQWEIDGKLVVVTHPDASGAPITYPVPTTATKTPYAGNRLWWLCPSCNRRVGMLYLLDDRDRLACRRCCALGYASQYPLAKDRRGHRLSVPVLTLTTTVVTWGAGQISKLERVRVFGAVD